MPINLSGSLELTGSLVVTGGITMSGSIASSSFALTASSADNLLVRNTLTAQTLVVQTITSSVDFVTGSTRFGSISENTHQFTGSVNITGSLSLNNITIPTSASLASTYLQLAGGTLSGALSGTSATFSSTINAAFANGNIKLSGGVVDGFLGVGVSDSKLYLTDYATAVKGLILDLTTGAASFSNSITATQGTFTATANTYAGGALILKASGGTNPIYLTSSGGFFALSNGGSVDHLLITSSGAASFSNSITAASFIQTSGNATYFRAGNYTWMGGSGGDYGSVGYNIGYTGTSTTYNYAVSDFASMLRFDSGGFVFLNATNGTAGNPITFTPRLTIANGGFVGIGTSSPSSILNIVDTSANNTTLTLGVQGEVPTIKAGGSNTDLQLEAVGSGGFIDFVTNGTSKMKVMPDGDVFIGTNTGTGFTNASRIKGPSTTENTEIISIDGGVEYSGFFKAVSGANYNGNACGMVIGRNTSSLRSINAGGTINATGTDYAEYMFKAIEDNIAKGDIVGINIEGKLTNIFDDSISFVVKSTDPSYVGGDTWGNSDSIGKEPRIEEGQTDEEYEQLKAEYQVKLEGVRAKVDRIAFSGQVPCNITGANVGDYIIPIELENGKIGGQAVTNPTFEQYQISVGKVWKIMEDGRAWIAVKIG
jgi:hypothetical protein